MIKIINSNNDKVLTSISLNGLMAGEVTATAELLAYENNIDTSDIKIVKSD